MAAAATATATATAAAKSVPPHPEFIYRLCVESEWKSAQQTGKFLGTAIDIKDGYIHLSTKAQSAETARKYFAAVKDLYILKIATAKVCHVM